MRGVVGWLAAATSLAGLGAAPARAEAPDWEARIEALEQELATVKRRLEVKEEADAARAQETPVVGAGKDGFFLRSPDGKSFNFKLRGYLQADTRWLASGDSQGSDTFAMRRVRPVFEGTLLEHIDWRLMPDFSGGSPQLFDAFVNLKYLPEAQILMGKFKSPVGLERLQSATATMFIERGLPTFLVPTRDIGVQVWSDLRGGLFSYAIGAFNGARDSGNADVSDVDPDDSKDLIARFFAHPFQETGIDALRGLGIGVSVSYGQEEQAAPSFRMAWDTSNFFAYRGAVAGPPALPAVTADGERLRFSPQGYWYWGPFGLLWEYVHSEQQLERGNANRIEAQNQAWQIAASYVLTGENASFKGVIPRSNFWIGAGSGWGAFEIAARYGQLQIDNDVFPFYADPAVAVQEVEGWGVGANWYANRWLRLMLDFESYNFDGGAPTGDRNTERVFLTRLQINY
jgi:phosphate-selective porin OprO/OprP